MSNIWSTITLVLYLGYYIAYYNFVQCFSPDRWRYVHLVFTFGTSLLHLMEKPCYLSLGLLHTTTQHSIHAGDLSAPDCCAETESSVVVFIHVQTCAWRSECEQTTAATAQQSCPLCWNHGSLLHSWDCCYSSWLATRIISPLLLDKGKYETSVVNIFYIFYILLKQGNSVLFNYIFLSFHFRSANSFITFITWTNHSNFL